MKKLASLPSLPVMTAIILAVAISCSVVVHCSEARAQADAAVPHPDGDHQGQVPPAPQGKTPIQPQPPCCERPGV
ncbi:hypothetical protein SEVIR_5G075100v4 [Setaria viridis]|uniref:Secreted protein n=2 Tax=Setaria TaxID=4554 RepID=K3XUI6_SETIT|nr:hypothetical protein SEVIR_5G075100v2 [Setaria viridis]